MDPTAEIPFDPNDPEPAGKCNCGDSIYSGGNCPRKEWGSTQYRDYYHCPKREGLFSIKDVA